MNEPSDEDLLRRIVRHSDHDAFRELYQRHEAAAYNLALHISSNQALAEEAVQDAMMRAWKYARAYDEKKGSVRTWLLRIVARQGMERAMGVRKSRREQAEDTEMLEGRADAKVRAPEENAEQVEVLGALRILLNKMPSAERRMVALYYGGGLSHEEIADALEMPRRTVTHRIQQALEQLRDELGKAGFAATAIPLLAGERLADAVCGGTQVPATLSARVLNGVAGAAVLQKGAAVSRRAVATARASKLSWAVGAGLFVVGAVGLRFSLRQTTTPPAQAPVAAVPSTPARAKQIDRVWTFKDGPQADLKPTVGVWSWKKENAAWGGVMELVKQDVLSFPLPFEAPRQPFYVRAEYTAVRDGAEKQFMNFSTFYGKSPSEMHPDFYEGRLIYYMPSLDLNVWHTVHTYFWDRYVCVYVDHVLTCLYTLQEPYPISEVFVGFGGSIKVRKIEFHTLGDQALPADLRDVDALKARMLGMKDANDRPKLTLQQE